MGGFHPARRGGHAVKHDLVDGRQGRAVAEARLKSWAERRWLDAAEARHLRSGRVAKISLPTKDRRLEPYVTGDPLSCRKKARCRNSTASAYAATMWSAIPLADVDPWLTPRSTGERTIAFSLLWDLGLGVAEAMDTAQRAPDFDWAGARELNCAARSPPPRRGRAR